MLRLYKTPFKFIKQRIKTIKFEIIIFYYCSLKEIKKHLDFRSFQVTGLIFFIWSIFKLLSLCILLVDDADLFSVVSTLLPLIYNPKNINIITSYLSCLIYPSHIVYYHLNFYSPQSSAFYELVMSSNLDKSNFLGAKFRLKNRSLYHPLKEIFI